jgi:hypothetical protein
VQLTDALREHAASTAVYAGSPEHKLPGARSDATLCPSDLNGIQPELTTWVKEAIARGHVGGVIEGQFPRYIWYRSSDGRHFEGRLTNQALGHYKGYPIDALEFPSELKTSSDD